MEVQQDRDVEAQSSMHAANRPPAVPLSRTSSRISSKKARSRRTTRRSGQQRVQNASQSRSSSPASAASGTARVSAKSSSSVSSSISNEGEDEDIEESGLFDFAEGLREDQNEPWFMEMSRLRRCHFLYLNKRLAACRKRILQRRQVSDKDMEDLTILLRDQGT